MADLSLPPTAPVRATLWERLRSAITDRIASPAFQAWATRNPLTRPFARRDAERLYDLVAGFVYSQVLLACVELQLFETLRGGPQSARALAHRHGLAPERMARLCQAAAAIGLLRRDRHGRYALARLGAATLGVEGLDAMIRHHAVFYRDLADPVALLRGETDPELARFWPYVLGGDRGEAGAGTPETSETPETSDTAATAEATEAAETAARYSDLMASSQHLVAEETLDALDLSGIRHLADIGGGTGMFLSHVARRHPALRLTLMDLPPVLASAQALDSRIARHPGSFLDDPLPQGADAISLIRVCYDHDDPTVTRLLARVHAALPSGGRVIVSEPMSGGDRPSRAGDAYFGFYTMAMTTGRPRSAARHAGLLAGAGFAEARAHRTRRPFLTGVVSARKP